MTTAPAQERTAVTPEDRENLAVRINGRPLPVNPTTLGRIIERDEAIRRADQIIGDGWTPTNTPTPEGADVRARLAAIISGAKSPSERSYKKADEILAFLGGRA